MPGVAGLAPAATSYTSSRHSSRHRLVARLELRSSRVQFDCIAKSASKLDVSSPDRTMDPMWRWGCEERETLTTARTSVPLCWVLLRIFSSHRSSKRASRVQPHRCAEHPPVAGLPEPYHGLNRKVQRSWAPTAFLQECRGVRSAPRVPTSGTGTCRTTLSSGSPEPGARACRGPRSSASRECQSLV